MVLSEKKEDVSPVQQDVSYAILKNVLLVKLVCFCLKKSALIPVLRNIMILAMSVYLVRNIVRLVIK